MLAQFKTHEKSLVEEVHRSVKSEMQNNFLPEIVKTVTMTIEHSVVKPLQASMEKTLQQHTDVHTEAIMTQELIDSKGKAMGTCVKLTLPI